MFGKPQRDLLVLLLLFISGSGAAILQHCNFVKIVSLFVLSSRQRVAVSAVAGRGEGKGGGRTREMPRQPRSDDLHKQG